MGIYNINESYIFSGDDIVMNFDKWKANTPNNILYVTGLSGSGKSTLAEEYEKKYKAEMFEIDGFEHGYDSSKSNLLQKVKDKYPEYDTALKNKFKDLNEQGYFDLLTKCMTFIIKEINKSGKLFILEGLQIFENFNPDTLKSRPLVIKGSSVTKSIYQRCKREGSYNKIDWIKELKSKDLSFFKWYANSEKHLNKFKKDMRNESTIVNELATKSSITADFKNAESVQLSKFKKNKLSVEFIDKYKKEYKSLKHIRVENTNGYFYMDNTKISCYVIVETKNDENWIQALEVFEEYKGLGLSKQLLKVAVTELEATNLTVNKNNELAIDIYKKFGFKEYDKSEKVIFMKYDTRSNIVNESASDRKYKCPYCEHRNFKEPLISHVEDEHDDMLSEEYPASRAVFNFINKKDHGTCIVCGKESKWNNDTYRYNRLCENPKCQKTYVESFKSRMVNKYGKETLLDDPEQQKRMLSNRKISGTYKFTDGGVRSYCGTYELKCLQFYDKVMNVHSRDVITPGPVIEYEYNGKMLKWITDIYYVPANLVHDVKDGKDNPNNRQMEDYRAKQIAKEEAISKMGKYNYIRLTDNSFDQLLLILAEIKYQMMDDSKDNKDFIIRINESAIGAAMPNQNNQSDTGYIVPYMMNNCFNVALSTDKYFSKIYKIEDNKIKRMSIDEISDSNYSIYEYKGNDFKDIMYKRILEDYKNQVDVDSEYYLYEKVCGKKLMSRDQFDFDELLEETMDAYLEAVIGVQINEASLNHNIRKINNTNLYSEIANMNMTLPENCKIFKDIDGYFVYNENAERRTKSYDNVSIIPYMIASKLR